MWDHVPGLIQLKHFPLFTLKAISAAVAKRGVLTVPGFRPRLPGFEFQMCSLLDATYPLCASVFFNGEMGLFNSSYLTWLPGWLMVKNLPTNAGDG